MPSVPAAILHLEDSDLDAELVRDRLERSGLAVSVDRVADRAEFVTRLAGRRYDLILSDYQVPSFEGTAALDLARAHQPDSPFIFVSGAMGEELAVEAIKRGATDYVLKDRLVRLPVAVERALAGARDKAERGKAERRASAILENMGEAFSLLDGDWRFVYVNAAFERMNGVGREDILGKDHWEVYPATVGTRVESEFRRVAAEGVTAEFENRYEPWDRWFAVKAYPSPDGGVCVQARDVTDAKRAAAELERRGEELRLITDAVPALISYVDADGRYRFVNREYEVWFGRPRSEIVGRHLRDVLGEEAYAAVRPCVDRALAGETFDFETFAAYRDGGGRHIHASYVPRVEDGRVVGYFALVTDVTGQKQAAEDLARLLERERRHAALLERVAVASRSINAVLSAESIARIVTEEARAILGAKSAVTTFTTAENCSQEVRAASSEGEGGHRPDGEISLAADLAAEVCEENRPVRLSRAAVRARACSRLAAPLVGHGGKNLGVVQLADKDGEDFTAEDEAVLVQLTAIASVGIENARLYDAVREQDKRKDEFLATLAHELRNPLAPIRSGLAVLRVAPADGEVAAGVREVIERQVGHMVRLIDDLLDVSRITSGKVELRKHRIDVRGVLDAALEVSRPLIEGSRHTLAVTPPVEPLPLDADATRLAQAVSNLLNNAAKYTPDGGHIDLSAVREGDEAVIRVRDDGVGIPADMLPKVFELFTQVGLSLDRAQGGLGIGLALVSRLVEMHGGSVAAESPGHGQGSTFAIRLPLAPPSASPTAGPANRDADPSPASARRVLVVDDNVDGAQTLAMLLKYAGHTAATAFTGPAALEAARDFRPEVIFLDIGLPGMSGYEVARRLKADKATEGMILVALTGWGTEEDRQRAKEAGFEHHLTKPVDAGRVQSLLSALFVSRPPGRVPGPLGCRAGGDRGPASGAIGPWGGDGSDKPGLTGDRAAST